jgi:hypothetical protein
MITPPTPPIPPALAQANAQIAKQAAIINEFLTNPAAPNAPNNSNNSTPTNTTAKSAPSTPNFVPARLQILTAIGFYYLAISQVTPLSHMYILCMGTAIGTLVLSIQSIVTMSTK